MELRVLGCHGGETPRHRTTAFLVDERLTIDAGALTSQLELTDQGRIEAILVSHAHLDHVRDLATIADNRAQMGCAPLTIAATKSTIHELKTHFFNDRLWPNFAVIPDADAPTIQYMEIPLEKPTRVLDYTVTAVAVDHTVESAGFILDDGKGSIGFSGDTGPTDRFWEVLNGVENLRALLMEVSFPDEEQVLATASGHHTPQTLIKDLQKFDRRGDVATMLYHIKPPFQAQVEKQCAKLNDVHLEVLQLKDQFVL
jgi:ribonuclease BN (tRNA processing enzyme)